VALATALLELDGDEAEAQAEAQLARLAASAGDITSALDLLTAAIDIYRAFGDDQVAAHLAAERESIGKIAHRDHDRQAPDNGDQLLFRADELRGRDCPR